MDNNFDRLYGQLTPALKQLEDKRLELKKKGTQNGLIAGGICFMVGTGITFGIEAGYTGIIIATLIGIIVLFLCINSQSAVLSGYYKKDIITTLLTSLCKDSSFQPEKGISKTAFMSSGLFSTTPDRYHSEDMITGQLEKTAFVCSEVHAEEKHVTVESKGHRHESWVDIFRGFFFIADFHKDFKGQTIIYRNAWIKLNFNNRRVKLENPDFEKSFDVYSTDQVEARYLLTPGMMEKLLMLDRKFPGKITVSFYNSNIIIAIPDRTDHFETSIWRSQLHNNSLKQEYDTLSALTGIVNDLNLNLRIWSKE